MENFMCLKLPKYLKRAGQRIDAVYIYVGAQKAAYYGAFSHLI